ncbi:MAG: hypothetical protein LW599_03850 [Rickettsiaceae bacterium]|jgi:hypothetical protein|nr:hypothetical protein [Rickettsiaceae bacterium]
MERVRLNRALNKEIKYYGLSYLGLIGASLIGSLVWMKLGMTIGIICFVIGYGFSAYAARGWHSGSIQRFIYWHLGFKNFFGGKYLPEAHKRCFL